MRFRALVMAVFVMAFGAMVAHAGVPQTLGIGGGLTLPNGDASDFFGSGFFIGATHCYKVNPQFGFGADLNYHMLGEKTLGNTKYKLSVGQFDLNGKYFFPMKDAKMAPYVKVGLGLYDLSIKATRSNLEGTTSENKFGFNAGVGSTFATGDKASFGVEVLYHMISTDNKSTDLLTAGVTYNFNFGK